MIYDYLTHSNFKSPNFRTIHWRVSKIKKDEIQILTYKEGKKLTIVVDSTGIKAVNDGEYRSTKCGKVKVWRKLHIAIDLSTLRILNIKVTKNDAGDSRMFIPLVKPLAKSKRIERVIADGAYDSEQNFEFCDKKGIQTLIPVRLNSISKSRHRRERVVEQLKIKKRARGYNAFSKDEKAKNQNEWKKLSGYHKRSVVESVFSKFKGTFGEYTFSKRPKKKEKELL